MYLWKTEELVRELKRGQLSQWDVTKYLIATTMFWYFSGGAYFDPSDVEAWDWITNLLIAVVAALGIYYCYMKNRRGDDKDFIFRFICLSLPVTIRWTVITLTVFLFLVAIYSSFGVSINDWGLSFYLIAMTVLYFYMLSLYIGLTSMSDNEG